MNTKDKARIESWLRTPESDAPVPDFVEHELEQPFEIDLSEWLPVEPPPDFAERVLDEVERMRSEGISPEEDVPEPPLMDVERVELRPAAAPRESVRGSNRRRSLKAGLRAAASARTSKKGPSHPSPSRPGPV